MQSEDRSIFPSGVINLLHVSWLFSTDISGKVRREVNKKMSQTVSKRSFPHRNLRFISAEDLTVLS